MPKIFSLCLCSILTLSSIVKAEMPFFVSKSEDSYVLEPNITFEYSKEETLNKAFNSIPTQTAIAISTTKDKDKKFNELNYVSESNIPVKDEMVVEPVEKMQQESITETPVIETSENENLKQDDLSTENDTFMSWWENDIIVANGYGMKPPNSENPVQAEILAKRAAIADGYRRLAEIIGSVQITANNTAINTEIKATIVGAKIVSEEFDDSGKCIVTLQVPVYGVIDSFASAVLKPIEKEDFPLPNENVETLGTYTGVVIDCGDLELNPVLTPSIQKTDDEFIYSYYNLDSNQVIAQGMIGYKANEEIKSSDNCLLLGATSDRDGVDRVGNNPLVVKAVALNNDGSCPVINADDANKILSENQVSHFLDRGAVVFTSNRIRGMRM